MENRGYFIIDGSHLFSSIDNIQKRRPKFRNLHLHIGRLSEALMREWSIYVGETVRSIYYFKKSDARLRSMLTIPSSQLPGLKDHWQIHECGESIKSIPQRELDKIGQKWRDCVKRAEKGLDIKLTCDVLILLSGAKASNFVFLVNDRDYIPLFEAIQALGGNVYLTALDRGTNIQKKLANLADRYLTLDSELDFIFGVTESEGTEPPQQNLFTDPSSSPEKLEL